MEPKFIYPAAENLVFYELDTLAVSYESSIKNTSLWTFCWEGPDLKTKKIIQEAKPMSGSEFIQIDFHTTSDNCWFNLRDNDNPDQQGANSVRFSISENQRSQTTLGASPTEPTTSIASKSTQTSTITAASSSGGLSSGARAGIGVGVTLALLGIAAMIGALLMLKKRKRYTQHPLPARPMEPLIISPYTEKTPALVELESPNDKRLPELPC